MSAAASTGSRLFPWSIENCDFSKPTPCAICSARVDGQKGMLFAGQIVQMYLPVCNACYAAHSHKQGQRPPAKDLKGVARPF